MGGGGPLQPGDWKNANVNELTDFDNRDPISGFPVFKALLCEVEKAEAMILGEMGMLGKWGVRRCRDRALGKWGEKR